MAYPDQIDLWGMQKAKFDGEEETPDYLKQADVYAKEKEDAYQEALKGIPDEPNPSVWRRLAAGALGAFGGYHQQFVDPRQTQAAVQGVLQGDYPTRYKNAQDAVKRAEGGVAMADRGRQRANEQYNVESRSKDRKASAELKKAQDDQNNAINFERSIGARGRVLPPEEMNDPAVQESIKAGQAYTTTAPDGRVFIVETPSHVRDQKLAAQKLLDEREYAARKERADADRSSREGTAADRNAVMLAIAGMHNAGQKATDNLGRKLDADDKKRKTAASKGLWDDYGQRVESKLNTVKKAQLEVASGRLPKEALAQIEATVNGEIAADLKQTRLRDASTWDLLPAEYEAHAAQIRPAAKGEPKQPDGPKQPAPAATGGPPVGTVKNGYRFKGGNPNDPTRWEKV